VKAGNKDYVEARRMQAVAELLDGNHLVAEQICVEVLKVAPEDVQTRATLAAIYLEQGRSDESRALAKALALVETDVTEELYKIATVCCENGMHEEAYRHFKKLDGKMPYDGRMLYFKAVSAYKSGYINEAEEALDELCAVYPDAEVAKYYLRQIRAYKAAVEEGENATPPELIYFYHLPQEERELRCNGLLKVNNCSGDEAQLFGLLILRDGYLHWCFDEMDGSDHDLQFLALVTANHIRADEFIQDVLLDYEVADVLKVETVRMLLERNEDMDVGLVLCSIYRKLPLYRIKLGRKRRKKFLEGYAKIASKFVVINDAYSEKIAGCAELLYRALESQNALELVNSSDDVACAIFFLAGLKELGNDPKRIAAAFEADFVKVQGLLAHVLGDHDQKEGKENEEKADEMD
jgi:hypothetical protein